MLDSFIHGENFNRSFLCVFNSVFYSLIGTRIIQEICSEQLNYSGIDSLHAGIHRLCITSYAATKVQILLSI